MPGTGGIYHKFPSAGSGCLAAWISVDVSLTVLFDEERVPHLETISILAGPQDLAGDSALIYKSLSLKIR